MSHEAAALLLLPQQHASLLMLLSVITAKEDGAPPLFCKLPQRGGGDPDEGTKAGDWKQQGLAG
jgi:hypothetical protein